LPYSTNNGLQLEREILEYPGWSNTYIFLTEGITRKFSDPFIYGEEQQEIFKEIASKVAEMLLKVHPDMSADNTLVIRILEGGRYYYVYEALCNILGSTIPLGEIDIKTRFKYNPSDIETKIVSDLNIINRQIYPKYIVIPDTIASGSTMETMLKRLYHAFHHKYHLIIGGVVTLKGLDRVRRWLVDNNFEYTFFAYGGLLGLGFNMTDMTLGDKPNYIPPTVIEKAVERLGEEIASKLCVIGDFTYSNKYVEKYLAERLIQIWEIGVNSSKQKTKEKAGELLLQGLSKLLDFISVDEIELVLAEEYRRRKALVGEEVNIERVSLGELLSFKKF